MPNGWSGSFAIKAAELRELVKAVPGTTEIGKIVVYPLPIRAANAAEVTRFVEECPHDRVEVEEQEHTFYIIHFSNEPKILWLVIGPESPIFLAIRERHVQGTREHPGRKG
jgi:hypothetical protein